MVLAPESELVDRLTTPEQRAEVLAYVEARRKEPNENASPTARLVAFSLALTPLTHLQATHFPSG